MFNFGEAEPENRGSWLGFAGANMFVKGSFGWAFQNDWGWLSTGNLCLPVFWACMVFWQTMFNAVVSVAEGASER